MAEEKRKPIKLGLNLDDYRYEARYCDGQPHCQYIDINYITGVDFAIRCPSWQKNWFYPYGPRGKCHLVDQLLAGGLDYSDPALRDIVYEDPMCGGCDAGCKRNMDLEIQLMLESLRARLVEKGNGPMPQHVPITNNIESSRNRYGIAQRKRHEWIPKDVKTTKKADILYFVGCRAALVDTEIATATARILNAANADFMMLDDEPCCGHFLFITGQIEKARKLAAANLKLLRESGAKTIVFSCPEGYKTVKVDYPKLLDFPTDDLGFQPVHITELVDQWVKEGRLKLENRVDMKLTYHDPCNLGRLSEPWIPWEGTRGKYSRLVPPRTMRRGISGVYEPPRDILKAIPGVELVEMVRHHDSAWCCCNDGGVKEAFPDLASFGASERLREAATIGAQAIVSCCPGCKENFSDAAKNGMKVYDITELIATAIGK